MTVTKLISPGTTPDYWLYSVWNDQKVVASGFRNTEAEANKAADTVIKSLASQRRAVRLVQGQIGKKTT